MGAGRAGSRCSHRGNICRCREGPGVEIRQNKKGQALSLGRTHSRMGIADGSPGSNPPCALSWPHRTPQGNPSFWWKPQRSFHTGPIMPPGSSQLGPEAPAGHSPCHSLLPTPSAPTSPVFSPRPLGHLHLHLRAWRGSWVEEAERGWAWVPSPAG